jgi:hypothetical protein
MKKFIAIAAFAAALVATVSCNKEQNNDSTLTTTKTLSFGFENPDSKTYVNDPASGTIWWGVSDVDKVVFVFDENCTKYPFVSTSTTPEAVRDFSCETWPVNAQQSFVVWSGRYISGTSQNDETTVDGDIINGLVLPNIHYNDHASSFAYNTNVAVMKPGDTALRNVFGYIRYTIPATDGFASIKNVSIQADEFLAGPVQIDYSGSVPVATIVGAGQNSVNADANFNGGYEAGSYYMTVPAGTYHNVKITITPFTKSADRTQKNAITGAPFTLSAKADVVVERGKFTDAGELPYVDPNEEEEDDDVEWPTDKDTFDYGYPKGSKHTASYPADDRKAPEIVAVYGENGIKNNSQIRNEEGYLPTVTLDKVTYYYVMTFQDDRWKTGQVAGPNVWMDSYEGIIPQNRCFSFKINRPGKLRYFCSAEDEKFLSRGIMYTLSLLKTVSGDESAKILYDIEPETTNIGVMKKPYQTGTDNYWLELEVTKEDLMGIDEAATLYFFHHTKKYLTSSSPQTVQVRHCKFEWIPAAKEPNE